MANDPSLATRCRAELARIDARLVRAKYTAQAARKITLLRNQARAELGQGRYGECMETVRKLLHLLGLT